MSAPSVTSAVTGSSSSRSSTRSALANTWVRLAPRLASATTGPKELSAASVQTSTPSASIAPFWYSWRLTPSTARTVNRMRVLVAPTVTPSRYFSVFCFSPTASL